MKKSSGSPSLTAPSPSTGISAAPLTAPGSPTGASAAGASLTGGLREGSA